MRRDRWEWSGRGGGMGAASPLTPAPLRTHALNPPPRRGNHPMRGGGRGGPRHRRGPRRCGGGSGAWGPGAPRSPAPGASVTGEGGAAAAAAGESDGGGGHDMPDGGGHSSTTLSPPPPRVADRWEWCVLPAPPSGGRKNEKRENINSVASDSGAISKRLGCKGSAWALNPPQGWMGPPPAPPAAPSVGALGHQ